MKSYYLFEDIIYSINTNNGIPSAGIQHYYSHVQRDWVSFIDVWSGELTLDIMSKGEFISKEEVDKYLLLQELKA